MIRLALLVLVCIGCGPKRGNQCPGNNNSMCVSGEECSFDHQRGCHVCQCRRFDGPLTPEPDDPTKPSREPQ